MLKHKEILTEIEQTIGKIHEVLAIEKGFSGEKKWRVMTEKGTFLLRASLDSYEKKIEEYDLLVHLYRKGVRCNEPVGIFRSADLKITYSLFRYLPGRDAESCINEISSSDQYKIGVQAGKDLKMINSVVGKTRNWNLRKWQKHEHYVKLYKGLDYRFDGDARVLKFIETNYNRTGSENDSLQHDDFHLGNIIINDNRYGGILDFNRHDWGDHLHEFVKLEWFTWPISKDFARGQVRGYFEGHSVSDEGCLKISVYIAMSIFSSIVWTLNFHPHTMESIEKKIKSILERYEFFEKTIPDWAS